MSRLTSHWPALTHAEHELSHTYRSAPDRDGPSTAQTVLIAAGLVAVGVGILAWTYLGPDLKRYMKIQSM